MTGLLLALLACDGPKPADTPLDTAVPDSDTDSAAPGDCYTDADLDGFGDPTSPAACRGTAVSDATDCDDTRWEVYPGAPEVCDGLDDDCDALVDDADPDLVDGLPFWADADGDGYGDETRLVTSCAAGSGTALSGGDCDDTDADVHPGAEEACDGVDRDCDGAGATVVGSGAACPASSCAEILALDPAAPDGAYWLALPSGGEAAVWCDMTHDGGGWTLGLLRNSAASGTQGDFGAADQSPEALGVSPAEASTSSTPALAWLDLAALDWTELRLGAWYGGALTYGSRSIARSSLRIPFGSDGYYLYGEDGYYWCAGDTGYTDAGVGAVDNPSGATLDCKGHGSLGSGWDFSESLSANQGLTLCGSDGSNFLGGYWGGTWVTYGTPGAAQAIFIR